MLSLLGLRQRLIGLSASGYPALLLILYDATQFQREESADLIFCFLWNNRNNQR